jgi:uncharacterized protein YegP (UPF0339 family)
MKVIVYKKHLFWRVKLVATNGETLMVSETYYGRSNAVRAAQRLREQTASTRCMECEGSGKIYAGSVAAECSNCGGTGRV